MNLETLIQELNLYFTQNKDLSIAQPILERYKLDDWKKYIVFDKCKYTRNLIYHNHLFEIYLICWNNNQESSIHDHSSNGCLLKVLQNHLQEELYDYNLNLKTIQQVNTNEISYIHNDLGIHKIKNGNHQTITLHIYSPPKYITNSFS